MQNVRAKIVVFDDDPTGIQTVHGCLLLTDWSKTYLRQAFEDDVDFFYILTNTRAMTRIEAEATIRDAMQAVIDVNRDYGYRLYCISRSDSTLRGHFPLETDVMREVLQENGIKVWQKTPFCPAFIEVGRITIDGIHYMKEGNDLVPVSQTEFARDNVFAFHHSDLRQYIEEKGGRAEDYEIVSAKDYEELNAYTDQLLQVTADWDGAVVIRSSSSLPKALARIEDTDFYALPQSGAPACFIVGSHVKKTTAQLHQLLECPTTKGIELSINDILHHKSSLLQQTLETMRTLSEQGITPVVYTAREEVRINDADKRQQLGQEVSDFLVQIVQHLPFTPSYLVAKGGITSHDILCKGLGVKTARVMGQVMKGVPCIMTDHFPYIIFPGNVGEEDSLRKILN